MDRDYEQQTHRVEDSHWWYRGRRTVLERVLHGMRLPARARILDAGCGSGRNMVELTAHGTVTGVELSSVSVEIARRRGVGDVLEGSILEMPFPAESFDLAVSLDVIEHLDDDLRALKELRRVVVPGGRLLVTVPAYQWLWEWARRDQPSPSPLHPPLAARRRATGRLEMRADDLTSTPSFCPVAILLRALDPLSSKTTESSLDLWAPPAPPTGCSSGRSHSRPPSSGMAGAYPPGSPCSPSSSSAQPARSYT